MCDGTVARSDLRGTVRGNGSNDPLRLRRCAPQSRATGCRWCRVGKRCVVGKHRRRHRPAPAVAGLPALACLASAMGAGGLALALALPSDANHATPSTRVLDSAPAVASAPSTSSPPASSDPTSTDPTSTDASSSPPSTASTTPVSSSPAETSVSASPDPSTASTTSSVTESPVTGTPAGSAPDTLLPEPDPPLPLAIPPTMATPGPLDVATPTSEGRRWPVRRLSATARAPSTASSVLGTKAGSPSRDRSTPSRRTASTEAPSASGSASAAVLEPSPSATSRSGGAPAAGLPSPSQASARDPGSLPTDDSIHLHLELRRGPAMLFCGIVALGIFLAAGAATVQATGAHRRT